MNRKTSSWSLATDCNAIRRQHVLKGGKKKGEDLERNLRNNMKISLHAF